MKAVWFRKKTWELDVWAAFGPWRYWFYGWGNHRNGWHCFHNWGIGATVTLRLWDTKPGEGE